MKIHISTNRRPLLWASVCSLMIIPLALSLIYLVVHEGDASKPHIPELKRIADQIPVYPGFQRVGNDHLALGGSRASLQRQYRTNAQFPEIRKFYDAALANAGWGPPEVRPPSVIVGEQHHVTYHRGSFEFAVSQDNERPNFYSISVIWHG